MKIFSLALVAGVALVASTGFAQEGEEATPEATETEASSVDTAHEGMKEAAADVGDELNVRSDSGGYGNSGCGLGSMLFEPSNGFTQVFAATTNGTSANQTFAISSGTSNCDGTGYQAGATAAFIQTNRSALAKDIARGKGATITGLAEIAGCGNASVVGVTLQKNFKTIFSGASASDAQVTQSVIQVLKSDASLACNNLS